MKRLLGLIAFAIICAINLNGQKLVRSIILINGEPYIADLTVNGSVVDRYQKVPDYFNSNLKDEQIIAIAEKKGLISEGNIELYADKLDNDDIPSLNSFRPSFDDISDNKQYIAFSRNRAILNQQAVDQIRNISDAYQSGKVSKVTVNAYHFDTEASRILARNRGNAITDLLVTFGLPETNIEVNMPYGKEDDQLYYVYLSFQP